MKVKAIYYFNSPFVPTANTSLYNSDKAYGWFHGFTFIPSNETECINQSDNSVSAYGYTLHHRDTTPYLAVIPKPKNIGLDEMIDNVCGSLNRWALCQENRLPSVKIPYIVRGD